MVAVETDDMVAVKSINIFSAGAGVSAGVTTLEFPSDTTDTILILSGAELLTNCDN